MQRPGLGRHATSVLDGGTDPGAPYTQLMQDPNTTPGHTSPAPLASLAERARMRLPFSRISALVLLRSAPSPPPPLASASARPLSAPDAAPVSSPDAAAAAAAALCAAATHTRTTQQLSPRASNHRWHPLPPTLGPHTHFPAPFAAVATSSHRPSLTTRTWAVTTSKQHQNNIITRTWAVTTSLSLASFSSSLALAPEGAGASPPAASPLRPDLTLPTLPACPRQTAAGEAHEIAGTAWH
jgi:hypothetical protein